MKTNLNETTFMGRLGADPEYTVTKSGVPVAKFSLIANNYYGKNKEDTDYIDYVAWRNKADFAKNHLKKGMRIVALGSMETSFYVDKNGNKRKDTHIVLEGVKFVDPKPQKIMEAVISAEPKNNLAETYQPEFAEYANQLSPPDESRKTLDEEFYEEEGVDQADFEFQPGFDNENELEM